LNIDIITVYRILILADTTLMIYWLIKYLKLKAELLEALRKLSLVKDDLEICYEEKHELEDELESCRIKLEDCETELEEADPESYDYYVDKHYVI